MFKMNKCPKCGGRVENIALTSNPPIYKNICENCGELNINDIIKPMFIHPSNNIYLIKEFHSYYDYNLVYVTLNEDKAKEMLDTLNSKSETVVFYLEDMELDKFYGKEW